MAAGRDDRIIILVDMDCFYVQVEQKFAPEYINKPCAVVQYNTWKGGGIIAVNYEARVKGVKRPGRGEDAIKKCPDIHLFRVPEVRGKADLTRYREAGASVLDVLCKFSDCVERASIDEAYLDMTDVINAKMESGKRVFSNQIPNTFVIGWEDEENPKEAVENWLQMIYEEDHLYSDRMLAAAAVIVEDMRAAVLRETGFKCSAGIAHNKMLAKLSCGLHKPNKQTVTPQASVPLLYQTISVNKVRNLGGKLGEQVMQKLNAKMMADLFKLPKSEFVKNFGEKTGNWLYNVSRGIETEPVTPRQLPKSIGCGKNFPGKSSLDTKEKVLHWVKQLASELEERLLKDQENNQRVARLLTITVRNSTTPGYSVVSKSCPIVIYNAEKFSHDAFLVLQKFNTSTSNSWNPAILSLAMSAGKFEDKIHNNSCDIQSYFTGAMSPIKKKLSALEAATEGGSSNIDIVVDLMESENPKSGERDSSLPTTSKNTCPTNKKDIASFFKIRSPLSPKQDGESDEAVNVVPTELNHNLHVSEMEAPLVPASECDKSEKDPSHPDETPQKADAVVVKGFFARKLEERARTLANGDAKSSAAQTKPNLNTAPEPVSISPEMCGSSLSELDPELVLLCPKCSRRFPIWEEGEHADYHVALDLSKELRKEAQMARTLPVQNSGSSLVQTKSKTSRKRGNTSKLLSKTKKPLQQNTLDSFFK